jgi:hypothetical protein
MVLAGVDRFLGEEGAYVLGELTGEAGAEVPHGIHEELLAIRKSERESVEHRGTHRIASEPMAAPHPLGVEVDVARSDGHGG